MKGKTITLTINREDGKVFSHDYLTTTDLGDFSSTGISDFDSKGNYIIQASFAGTPATLLESYSTPQTLLVGNQAGYAVIVQGKTPIGEGLGDHNKITNRIYNTLKSRGFVDSNILYYNYNTGQPGVEVDGLPDKTAVMNGIIGMAGPMNESPAPFYLIMVDHGLPDTFYLGDDTIIPTELDSWLTTMESKLSGAAKGQPRTVILGFCYSGSFIQALSSPGRIIITSATASEKSSRGPLESDTFRSGELLLDDMFQNLLKGKTLGESFTESATTIRHKTQIGDGSMGPFGDGALQHPLIAEDGDKIGNNYVRISSVDKKLYLRVGDSITNAVSPEHRFSLWL